jgi:hypothetical protein
MDIRTFFKVVAATALLASACAGGKNSTSDSNNLTGPSPTPNSQPTTGNLAFSTTASRGWSSIDVFVDGRYIGSLSRYYSTQNATSSCTPVPDARVVATISAGTHSYSARTENGASWSGSDTISAGGCREVVLTCSNNDCSR